MNDFLKVVVYGGLFAVPFLTLYVANDLFFPFITGKNFAFRIIVEVIFLAWVVLALLDTKYRPRFSWILPSFSVLLIVMFFANLFGKHPASSFFSNFERMDGYITLVHVFLYVIVLASVITTKKVWGYFLHATLLAATITSFYGLAQYAGMTENYTGRIESYLGNASYMAIYMLFHIFIAFWLFVESKVTLQRVIYALLAVMFIFTLLQTGTRGTILGLVVGIGVMITYIMLFGSKYKEFRNYAFGAFAIFVVVVGGFFLARDSDFIQSSPNLARVANISLASDLEVRGTIWGMAWEGVKERPLLGWGQGNFNYVFNKNYDPFLWGQEQWFDRVHNIFFDWLIAGGFLGLIAYLSIFAACIYYLFVVPLINKEDLTFTVLERSVLLGLLAGYLAHNLVVFDNIVSYIFFALILALIHSRVGTLMPKVQQFQMDKNLITQFVAPVSAVLVIGLVYTLHLPGMQAASDIIVGYRSATPADKLAAFERAIARESFGSQEIAEQIAQQAMAIVRENTIAEDIRLQYVTVAERELFKMIEAKPDDARMHVFTGTFYRAIGNLDKAEEQFTIARELSPRKQSVISQQAIIAYNRGNLELARDLFGEAFLLEENNYEAREYYAALLFATGEAEQAIALAENEALLKRFAKNEFLIKAAEQAKAYPFMIELYKLLLEENPAMDQYWASLSFLYSQIGDTKSAVATLREAATVRPTFAKVANCLADNLEKGLEDPRTGCY